MAPCLRFAFAVLVLPACAGSPTPRPAAAESPPVAGAATDAASSPLPATAVSSPSPSQATLDERSGFAIPNATPLLRARGRGVQIYVCKQDTAGATASFGWTLKAPQADLFDARDQKIGKHYGGPTWELADGSKVVGKVKRKSALAGGDSIPWLLLDAVPGTATGSLAQAVTIARTDTTGGRPPTAVCDPAHDGLEVPTAYEASYVFYGPVAAGDAAAP